ncbi:bcl-2-binding component 3, isoforms 3/4-like [Molothrus aeneus]|uniref:bcl-2-binding component 3, isoforms 3/4-like n=1 Tax=Molothrus aeneus TaxID=84833 RepID=UPI003457C507
MDPARPTLPGKPHPPQGRRSCLNSNRRALNTPLNPRRPPLAALPQPAHADWLLPRAARPPIGCRARSAAPRGAHAPRPPLRRRCRRAARYALCTPPETPPSTPGPGRGAALLPPRVGPSASGAIVWVPLRTGRAGPEPPSASQPSGPGQCHVPPALRGERQVPRHRPARTLRAAAPGSAQSRAAPEETPGQRERGRSANAAREQRSERGVRRC